MYLHYYCSIILLEVARTTTISVLLGHALTQPFPAICLSGCCNLSHHLIVVSLRTYIIGRQILAKQNMSTSVASSLELASFCSIVSIGDKILIPSIIVEIIVRCTYLGTY